MSDTFHHSGIDSSRIQRIVQALRGASHWGMTTLELNESCGSTRASSDVSEARACGMPIECEYHGKSANGRKIYRYFLRQTPND